MKEKVAVLGFGYIGTCIGAVLADRGHDVTGIEPRKSVVDEINAGRTSVNEPGLHDVVRRAHAAGRLRATTEVSAAKDADVVVVTVGTPLGDDHAPDMRQITAAAEALAPHLRRGQLVVLKSTVPPGTTEDVVRPALERSGLRAGVDFHLAFCPERLAEGRALPELVSIPVVVGGTDAASTERAARFWKESLGVETLAVSNPRAAELSKLADNLWIDLNIALANEVALLADRLGVDAHEVIAAANTLPKGTHHVNILLPSLGVGGYCLTKDPWFVHALGREHGLDLLTPAASRRRNDAMPAYTVGLLRDALAEKGVALSDAKVAVLGVAFKSNTGDTRFTPAKEALRLLEGSGCTLAVHDPWVTAEDAREVTGAPLVANLEDAVRGADCVAFFTGHEEFRRFPLARLAELAPGCLVLDGRLFYSKAEIAEIRRLGMRYKGVGR